MGRVENFFSALSIINQHISVKANFFDLTFFERENMKNVIVMLAIVAGLSACASRQPEPQVAPAPAVAPAQNVQAPRRACGVKAPVQAPVAQQGCSSCGPRSYTVSEPVEVLYKNVTYTTVYEPKTYSETSYVKKPYSCPNGNLCGQKAPEPMAVEYRK